MRPAKFAFATVLVVLGALAIALGTCSGCHAAGGEGTTPDQGDHDCPPCPACPPGEPVTDPLAGSKIDDGFTGEQRVKFIRDNIESTLRIEIAVHSKEIGLGFGGGTGVAIRPNLVLTAAHVVNDYRFAYGVQRLLARDNLSIVYPRAVDFRVIAFSKMRDVALLELRDGETMSRPIPLSMGTPVKNGDLVWNFGRTTRWSRGKVLDASNPRNVKVEFTIAGGDSGGPVIRPDGTLAGINLSRSSEKVDILDDNTSKIGYFITADEAIKGLSFSAAGAE
jgi:hypothetical protein